MQIYKPKRLVAIVNGYEIGVESQNPNEDAATFDAFCEAFRKEISKLVAAPKDVAEVAKVS